MASFNPDDEATLDSHLKIRLKHSTLKRLRIIAKQENRSIGYVTRQAICDYLTRRES